MDPAELGKKIKQVRTQSKVPLKAFADKLGIPYARLIEYEKGEAAPPNAVLQRLARLTHDVDLMAEFLRLGGRAAHLTERKPRKPAAAQPGLLFAGPDERPRARPAQASEGPLTTRGAQQQVESLLGQYDQGGGRYNLLLIDRKDLKRLVADLLGLLK